MVGHTPLFWPNAGWQYLDTYIQILLHFLIYSLNKCTIIFIIFRTFLEIQYNIVSQTLLFYKYNVLIPILFFIKYKVLLSTILYKHLVTKLFIFYLEKLRKIFYEEVYKKTLTSQVLSIYRSVLPRNQENQILTREKILN